MKKMGLLIAMAMIFGANISFAQKQEPTDIVRLEPEPYDRPIGFSLNVGGITSMTFEGRFHYGLFPNLSLVAAPSFQNTLELPWYNYKKKSLAAFSIRRFHLGAGIRAHFNDYDSRDGWYIEPLIKGGMTWIGKDDMNWSIIPSIMVGYAAVYDSGYFVSFGLGLEWEKLFGKRGADWAYMHESYLTLTKLPIAGELSVGWLW